jgi:sucrose-phosphate synthase
MHILHLALGGCLSAPPVRYGLTEDTGGHIGFVLGAAAAQAARADVDQVWVATRAFDDARLGLVHGRELEIVGPKLSILRLRTANPAYLDKTALQGELPALTTALLSLLQGLRTRPDVIHAHFADAAGMALEARARFGIPVVYTPHSLARDKVRNLPASRDSDVRVAAECEAIRASDALIVSSRDETEQQVAGYGPRRAAVHAIAPGVSLPDDLGGTDAAEALLAPFLRDLGKPLILAIARPVAKKNLGGLLAAYAGTPELANLANLAILAGQQPTPGTLPAAQRGVVECLRTRAAAPDLRGRVALPPVHAPHAVPQLYRLAAARRGVFVNPALHEPFGLTILEAASFGLPVVATREGGPRDIVGQIGHGALVDPTDTDAIGGAILGLLTDAGRWRAASAAGLAGIGAFDWARWAEAASGVYASVVAGRPATAPARALVAADIDGTLTGSHAATRRFTAWVRRRSCPWVVATGRAIDEARAALAEWNLPEPDAFITAVGTEVHWPGADGGLRPCPRFARELDLGWDRGGVIEALEGIGLPPQAPVEQRRWKLGYVGTARDAERARRHLAAAGLGARIIASHGRFVDVLAPRGGKASAVAFVARAYGLSPENCVAAGDSGNDADMLLGCGHGILVANALPEVADALRGPSLYFARSRHADGVLEGLAAFGLADARARRRRGPVLAEVQG